MKHRIFLICIGVMFLLTGCSFQSFKQGNSGQTEAEKTELSASEEIFAMDTYMTFQAYGEKAQEAVEAAVKEINRLDVLLSTENTESKINIANQNGTVVLSEDTTEILEAALRLHKDTEGVFDITIYPLMEEWGFTNQKYHVPSSERIKQLLGTVDAGAIRYDSGSHLLELPEGVKIDFGGITKGYASNRMMEIFEEYGITSGLVSLGGNVQLCGNKTDGSKWTVAVESPDDSSDYLGVLKESDKAIITSGGYERYFEEDGQRWHHILNPATGYPASSGLKSVTVVCQDGMKADGLSTSLFVMGKEKALSYWKKHAEEFDAILVEENGDITVTEGLRESFTSELSFTIEEK